MSAHPPFALAWLEQRRSAATALAKAAEDELRSLDDDEALRRSDALLSTVKPDDLPDERRVSSGLVEQQRRLHEFRLHVILRKS